MTDVQADTLTANQRFDALWEEIGAKRVVIGDEEDGVEIRVDADLSVFTLLEKLKEAAQEGHDSGEISQDEQDLVSKAVDSLEAMTGKKSGGLFDRLREHFGKPDGGS